MGNLGQRDSEETGREQMHSGWIESGRCTLLITVDCWR